MGLSYEQALELVRDIPYKIGHIVGFKDLTELHNDWLRSFLLSKTDQTLLAHRGSYKTTDLSLFLQFTQLSALMKMLFFSERLTRT